MMLSTPYPTPDMQQICSSHDLLWLVLDSLRYDVAQSEWQSSHTPHLAKLLLRSGWERRHTPGSFTFAAHQAFFAGFLPTPTDPQASRDRLFAARFAGSETTSDCTQVFDEANVITGLRTLGYHTLCIGGVGFFNQQTALSRVLTDLFDESHWCEEFSVTRCDSSQHQFAFARERLREISRDKPVCCFINVSAIHQPNYFYSRDSGPDDLTSHAAALRAVDAALPQLLAGFAQRGRPLFHITCSDHGTAYGEEGFHGHRLAVPAVWDVPYAHGVVDFTQWEAAA